MLLVLIETVALMAGPVLTQIGIDDGIRAGDRSVLLVAAGVYVGAVALRRPRLGLRVLHRAPRRTAQREPPDPGLRPPPPPGGRLPHEEKAGVLLTRMTSDIEALSVLFQEGIVNLLVQVFTLLVITGVVLLRPAPRPPDPRGGGPADAGDLVVVPLRLGPFLPAGPRPDRRAALRTSRSRSPKIRAIAAHNRRRQRGPAPRCVVGEHRDANIAAARANSTYAP
ncbi:MAG: hypothetical protein R2695_09085 [Acidimicrobiales bacterium]